MKNDGNKKKDDKIELKEKDKNNEANLKNIPLNEIFSIEIRENIEEEEIFDFPEEFYPHELRPSGRRIDIIVKGK